ncbi:hypothetical protein VNO78_08947 [Psophocarpus tetragonolobus]|uniref:Uncharacterized protein n=1 Tax=Psophocarpus tetragonolobus TaxID=3891 RepID=A0AAN9SXU9_PSOTE
MLKRVVHSLGLVENTDKYVRRKSKVRGTKTPSDFGLRSKDLHVRIVHQGGQQEVYHHAFPASKLMTKYPGMCVARAQVFKASHQAVLRPEENLLLGHKYVIISCRDVEKLKRKHNGLTALESNIIRSPSGHKQEENDKISVPNEMINARITLSSSECKMYENGEVKEAKGLREEKVNAEMDVSQGGGDAEEVHCSAKDFYKSARYSRRKGIKVNKTFSPPLPKGRPYWGLGWKPSIGTVQELSP